MVKHYTNGVPFITVALVVSVPLVTAPPATPGLRVEYLSAPINVGTW